jgi:hypothetical protein
MAKDQSSGLPLHFCGKTLCFSFASRTCLGLSCASHVGAAALGRPVPLSERNLIFPKTHFTIVILSEEPLPHREQ